MRAHLKRQHAYWRSETVHHVSRGEPGQKDPERCTIIIRARVHGVGSGSRSPEVSSLLWQVKLSRRFETHFSSCRCPSYTRTPHFRKTLDVLEWKRLVSFACDHRLSSHFEQVRRKSFVNVAFHSEVWRGCINYQAFISSSAIVRNRYWKLAGTADLRYATIALSPVPLN